MGNSDRRTTIGADENKQSRDESLRHGEERQIRVRAQRRLCPHTDSPKVYALFRKRSPRFRRAAASRLISPHVARSTQRRLTQNVGERDITVQVRCPLPLLAVLLPSTICVLIQGLYPLDPARFSDASVLSGDILVAHMRGV